MTTADNPANNGWQQLHPKTIHVTAVTFGGLAIGTATPFVVGFADKAGLGLVLLIALGGVVVVTVAAALIDLMRWRHTTYRVTGCGRST